MHRKFVILLLLIMILFTTGCIDSNVKSNDDPSDDQSNYQTQSPQPPQLNKDYEVPAEIKKTLDVRGVSINATVDADPELYNKTYIIERTEMSQEKVDIIRNVLLQDTPIYFPSMEFGKTKEEINREISYLEEAVAANDVTAGNIIYIERIIEMLKEELSDAPLMADLISSDGKYINEQYVTSTGITEEMENVISVVADTGNIRMANFYARNPNDDRNFRRVEFGNNSGRGGAARYFYFNDSSIDGLKTTYDDAVKLANNTISAMGLDYLQISISLKDVIIRPYIESEYPYYSFIFTRNISGTSVSMINPVYNETINLNSSKQPVMDEFAVIEIDDSGIIGFLWYEPVELIEISEENALLFPFEEIVSIFEEQMKLQSAQSGVRTTDIEISNIRLSMASYKTETGLYAYVPVWDFIGVHTGNNIYKDTNNLWNTMQSYMTINALSGKLITRSLLSYINVST